MMLDRPVHAQETADRTTPNEAGAGVRLPVKARTNTPTGMRPSSPNRRQQSEGQLCPRLVRLSEVGPGPGAWGSLSFGTGRTGNLTE